MSNLKKIFFTFVSLGIISGLFFFFKGRQAPLDTSVIPSSDSIEIKSSDVLEKKEIIVEKTLPKEDIKKQAPQVNREFVDKFVKQTGVEKSFKNLDSMIRPQIEGMINHLDLSDQEKREVAGIFKKYLNGEDLLENYKQKIMEEFTADELEQIREVKTDPLHVSLNEEFQNMDQERLREKIEDFREDLKNNPMSADRKQKIEELSDLGNNSEFFADISMSAMKNMSAALDNGENSYNDSEMKQVYEGMKGQFKAEFASNAAFRTRDWSNDDLAGYLNRVKNPIVLKEDGLRKDVMRYPLDVVYRKLGKVVAAREKKNETSNL